MILSNLKIILQVVNGWAQHNDVNTYDDAPIFDVHLKHSKFYTMAGFGSYGKFLF